MSLMQTPGPWDLVAPTYAEDAAQWREYADEALRLCPVEATDRVLDLACGPGTLALRLAPRVARVDGVDFSPGMIEELRTRAQADGLSNITGHVMDAQHLGFPDAAFDAAYCMFGFFFFPDRAKAYAELVRVLRPGARFLMATWSPIERRPFMKLGFDAMAEALPHLPRPAKGDLQDPAECVKELTDAGFSQVECSAFDFGILLETPERYLTLVTRSAAPMAAMKKKLGPEAWQSAMAKMLEVLGRTFPAGGSKLTAEALFTRAVR
jgi:SAM-dependent methyltransferase